jgi:hypothetical protein
MRYMTHVTWLSAPGHKRTGYDLGIIAEDD